MIKKLAYCIKVLIDVDDNSFIDFENDKIKSNILALCDKLGISYFDVKEIGIVYNYLIHKMEEKLGTQIEAFETTVLPPKSCNFPINAIGLPKCLVVRKKSIIKIEEIYKEEDYD